jgi:hypothetical protein
MTDQGHSSAPTALRITARHFAERHPQKTAQALNGYLRRQIDRARDAGDEREAARLETIEAGYLDAMAGSWCIRCGRVLKDETQAGYRINVGPECYSKLTRAEVDALEARTAQAR